MLKNFVLFSWHSLFFYNFEIMIAAFSKMVTLRTDVIKTAHPLRIPMPRAVTLCSLKKKNNVVFSVIQPSEKNIWFKNWNDNMNFTILVHYLKYTIKEIIFHFFLKGPLFYFNICTSIALARIHNFFRGWGDGQGIFFFGHMWVLRSVYLITLLWIWEI